MCLYFVLCNTPPVRIYGEQYAHTFCAVDNFYNITRRQAISPVAKLHHVLGRGSPDSADDIDFYLMSLSQSESTILIESMISIMTYMLNSQYQVSESFEHI